MSKTISSRFKRHAFSFSFQVKTVVNQMKFRVLLYVCDFLLSYVLLYIKLNFYLKAQFKECII